MPQRVNNRSATCHPDRPYLARGLCSACYQREPDQIARTKKFIKTERWKAAQARYSSSIKGRLAAKRRRIQAEYGITLERYEEMLSLQDGGCAICKALPNGHRLAVDHDHSTGVIRGLLCIGCNLVLGNAKDDVKILEAAIKYLADYAKRSKLAEIRERADIDR